MGIQPDDLVLQRVRRGKPQLSLVRPSGLKTSFRVPAEATADVTLRRLQGVRLTEGVKVRWTFGAARGEVAADASGCATVPRLRITEEPTTLRIWPADH